MLRMLAVLALLGCEAAPADTGVGALLRISHAQFYPGAMPAGAAGPEVRATDLSRNDVVAGSIDRHLSGTLGKTATAVAIGIAGDSGYWVVTAGPEDVSEPGYPTFAVPLGFSSQMPAGMYQLIVHGVDRAGRFGPPVMLPLTASGPRLPEGILVVSLRWDRNADLDLHVVDPSGTEIWARNINSYTMPPPGEPIDPNAWKAGGMLDFDSNAQCVIDGLRREDVIWAMQPPSGHYIVRVDAFSMCGEPEARWNVDVQLDEMEIGHASGLATDADTRGAHAAGAGTLAVEFDVP